MQRLPRNVHQIFASSSDTVDLEQLALNAYKIVEVASPPTVATFSKVRESPSLQAQVSQLTTLVQTLATTSYTRGRSRERSRSKVRKSKASRNCSPSKTTDIPRAGSDCWYHWRFGDKATKCVKPCSYSEPKSSQEN